LLLFVVEEGHVDVERGALPARAGVLDLEGIGDLHRPAYICIRQTEKGTGKPLKLMVTRK
jgi:hypothetical protein